MRKAILRPDKIPLHEGTRVIQTRLIARLNGAVARPFLSTLGTRRGSGSILAVLLGLGVLAAGLYVAPEPAAWGLAVLWPGLLVVLLLWQRPELGLLGLLFLTSSFVPANVVDWRLPIGGGLDLRDLALIGLTGLVGLRELVRGKLRVSWWGVGGPLLLFLVMALFSALYAIILQHVETNWALGDLRILSMYVVFFLTLWSLERPAQVRTLLIGLFIIVDLTTLIIYLQQFVGANNPILAVMTTSGNWRLYGGGDVVRVMPAGQVLMHFMWFVSLGRLVLGRPTPRVRTFYLAQLAFIGGGHLLTYTRAQWLAAFVGVGLISIVLLPRYRQNLPRAAVLACCAALLVAAVALAGSLWQVSAPPLVTGIADRFGSLFTPGETEQTGSLQWRAFEFEKASQAIRKQPLTGVGLGNRYRELTAYESEASGNLTRGSIVAGDVSRFTRYVHNSYVSIAVKMGIPGLLVIVWFCAAVLIKGFQVYRDMPDSGQKGVVLGVLAAFAGLLLWCYWHPHLIKAESTPTIALMVALIGSLRHVREAGSASPTPLDRPQTGEGSS